MGNNRVNIILHRRWNLATARTKRGNTFEALMWFPDVGMLHLWKDSRTNAPTLTVLGDVFFDYTWSLIRWRGIWPFHHLLQESQSRCFSTVTRWSKLFASDNYNATIAIRSYFFLQDQWYSLFWCQYGAFTYSTIVPRGHIGYLGTVIWSQWWRSSAGIDWLSTFPAQESHMI